MLHGRAVWICALSLPVCLALTLGSTCTGNTPQNPGGGANLSFVKTPIIIPSGVGLVAGDDLIAYGTGATTGVSYIVPSTSPTVGTPVLDTNAYASIGFTVVGKFILLVGATNGPTPNQVTVFDTQAGLAAPAIPNSTIHLNSIPTSPYAPLNMVTGGNLCVVVNDPTVVSDRAMVKIIDMTSGTAVVTSLLQNAVAAVSNVKDVALDAANRMVVVAAHGSTVDELFVYNIDTPSANPIPILLPNGFSADTHMGLANGFVFARDNASTPHVNLINLTTGRVIPITNNDAPLASVAGANLVMAGSQFAYFTADIANDTSGGQSRVAVGTVPGPGSTEATLNQVIGSSSSGGLLGFGQAMVIRSDASFIFLAGQGTICQGCFLQYSAGDTNFTVVSDAAGGNPFGLPASDLSISSNTLAFKTQQNGTNGSTIVIGYSQLP